MDLILWRHADAREAAEGEADAERPLTGKGERQARRMAEWLNHHLPESARVLVSPTLRTRQTADALGRKLRMVPALAPEGTVDALLQAARWPDAREPVLVVGHQATLGLSAAYLVAGIPQPWTIRKGALWWLRRRERAGQAEVIVQAVISPDGL
jgi:phosphohistidine phosphatase